MWSEFIANIRSCKTWFNFTSDLDGTSKWIQTKELEIMN